MYLQNIETHVFGYPQWFVGLGGSCIVWCVFGSDVYCSLCVFGSDVYCFQPFIPNCFPRTMAW